MPGQNITKIGNYEVVSVIAEGGMGIVYKGVDPRFGRPVAIKLMTSGFSKNEEALRRFYNEAQSVGNLQHPNIVVVYDLGDQDGTPFLVMEYLAGESLDRVIASRRELSIIEKLHIVIKVLRALHYAHQRRIIHRDVKPGNVMVTPDGDCKLVDFGIARAGDVNLTQTGQIIGSMSYMSPEQINGREVDGRTDVWSAGILLYQLLTYHLPFEGRDTASLIVKILGENPPPLSTYLDHPYPTELDEIIGRALVKDREARFDSAEEFAIDLANVEAMLKANIVSEYLDNARASMDSDLGRAQDLLSSVLKMDSQNSTAKQMLYQVQQLMRQQRSGQVQTLRLRAAEALDRSNWEDALILVDQALKLDQTNPDLISLHASVLQRKALKEQIVKLVHTAEAAQQAGEFEIARRAVDDALAMDPSDTRARALGSELYKIEQHRRFEALLESVRTEISSCRFEDADRLLREAETVNPQAREIGSLKNLIASGREEQIRTERFESLIREAEQLLSQEQFVQAQAKAEEALRHDSANRTVLNLLDRITKLQQNRWVDQQLSSAEKLVAEGRNSAALVLLETAAAHYRDARLQLQISALRQKLEQQIPASPHANVDRQIPATPRIETRIESVSSENTSGWQDDTLLVVEKQLATFIGSLARILVKKAALRTTDLDELYSILAASLESVVDREAFLGLKVDLKKSSTKSQTSQEPLHVASSAAPPNTTSVPELTAAVVDQAARMLARHVGPIAGVLAKRAANRSNSVRALYLVLSEHIENKSERSRFLQDAGFPDL